MCPRRAHGHRSGIWFVGRSVHLAADDRGVVLEVVDRSLDAFHARAELRERALGAVVVRQRGGDGALVLDVSLGCFSAELGGGSRGARARREGAAPRGRDRLLRLREEGVDLARGGGGDAAQLRVDRRLVRVGVHLHLGHLGDDVLRRRGGRDRGFIRAEGRVVASDVLVLHGAPTRCGREDESLGWL